MRKAIMGALEYFVDLAIKKLYLREPFLMEKFIFKIAKALKIK